MYAQLSKNQLNNEWGSLDNCMKHWGETDRNCLLAVYGKNNEKIYIIFTWMEIHQMSFLGNFHRVEDD